MENFSSRRHNITIKIGADSFFDTLFALWQIARELIFAREPIRKNSLVELESATATNGYWYSLTVAVDENADDL